MMETCEFSQHLWQDYHCQDTTAHSSTADHERQEANVDNSSWCRHPSLRCVLPTGTTPGLKDCTYSLPQMDAMQFDHAARSFSKKAVDAGLPARKTFAAGLRVQLWPAEMNRPVQAAAAGTALAGECS